MIDDAYDTLCHRFGRRRAAQLLADVDPFSSVEPTRAVHLAEERDRQYAHHTGANKKGLESQ